MSALYREESRSVLDHCSAASVSFFHYADETPLPHPGKGHLARYRRSKEAGSQSHGAGSRRDKE